MADVKLRELLEHPEEDNQQPSLSSNTPEGSETRSELPKGKKAHEHEASMNFKDPMWAVQANGRTLYYNLYGPFSGIDIRLLLDDIVRTVDITKETTESEDKELLR